MVCLFRLCEYLTIETFGGDYNVKYFFDQFNVYDKLDEDSENLFLLLSLIITVLAIRVVTFPH
jgi:hypothetical protein